MLLLCGLDRKNIVVRRKIVSVGNDSNSKVLSVMSLTPSLIMKTT